MLGMIVRMDKSGLGIQTRRLARLMKPNRIMLIDSTPFNSNEQFPEWYKDYPSIPIEGFPNELQISMFLRDLSHVVTAESFYSNNFVRIARQQRVKTIQIFNYEFWDNLRNPFLEVADILVQPSLWMLDEMSKKHEVIYLPTPIFEDEFKDVAKLNLKKTYRKYLFMNGKTASRDRNGLLCLYDAMQLSRGKFTVTVKAQNDIPKHPDPRIIYDFSNPEDQQELYSGYDAMILPRRYGGQALSMCEALSCALPVVMPDIEPNNKVLPPEWLVPAQKTDELQTRTVIDVYATDAKALAEKMDKSFTKEDKLKALKISEEYSAENLRPRYEELVR